MLKPRALRPGDRVGIAAPGGRPDLDALARGLALLAAWGFTPVVGEHLAAGHGYLAGTDQQRSADLNGFLQDTSVRAVICARGGYGCMRLLPHIDWTALRHDPKLLVGFSDVTALHLGWARHGVVSCHGPMAAGTSLGDETPAFNREWLHRALTQPQPLGTVTSPPGGPLVETLVPGVAGGRLVGGCLSLVAATLGTPYEIDTRDAILVLEDVDELPYRVDRLLCQLLLAGKLQAARGVVFGHAPTCEAGPPGKPSLTLREVLAELLVPLGKPLIYGFPCGHSAYRATLPLGVECRLDASAGSLTFCESATRA